MPAGNHTGKGGKGFGKRPMTGTMKQGPKDIATKAMGPPAKITSGLKKTSDHTPFTPRAKGSRLP